MPADSDSLANLGPSTAAGGPAGLDSFLTQVSRAIRFPGAAGQACYAPEGPHGALGQAVRASGGQPRAARQCGSFGGSAIQRKQDPFSSLLVAARDLGSRPPIVADVGGLEPSVPLVLLLVGESLGR